MTCPIDLKHHTFTSWIGNGNCQAIWIEACPTCQATFYADKESPNPKNLETAKLFKKDMEKGSDEVKDPCECPRCHQDYSACICHDDNLEGSGREKK